MSKSEWKIEIPKAELDRALRSMQAHEDSVTKALGRQVYYAGRRVEGRAKRNAPVKFGKLRQHIVASHKGLTSEIAVNVAYAGAVEFGSRPHVIRPRRKKALAFKPGGGFKFWDESGRVVLKKVNHPGTTAQPFLTPVIEEERAVFAAKVKLLIENPKKYM